MVHLPASEPRNTRLGKQISFGKCKALAVPPEMKPSGRRNPQRSHDSGTGQDVRERLGKEVDFLLYRGLKIGRTKTGSNLLKANLHHVPKGPPSHPSHQFAVFRECAAPPGRKDPKSRGREQVAAVEGQGPSERCRTFSLLGLWQVCKAHTNQLYKVLVLDFSRLVAGCTQPGLRLIDAEQNVLVHVEDVLKE